MNLGRRCWRFQRTTSRFLMNRSLARYHCASRARDAGSERSRHQNPAGIFRKCRVILYYYLFNVSPRNYRRTRFMCFQVSETIEDGPRVLQNSNMVAGEPMMSLTLEKLGQCVKTLLWWHKTTEEASFAGIIVEPFAFLQLSSMPAC